MRPKPSSLPLKSPGWIKILQLLKIPAPPPPPPKAHLAPAEGADEAESTQGRRVNKPKDMENKCLSIYLHQHRDITTHHERQWLHLNYHSNGGWRMKTNKKANYEWEDECTCTHMMAHDARSISMWQGCAAWWQMQATWRKMPCQLHNNN